MQKSFRMYTLCTLSIISVEKSNEIMERTNFLYVELLHSLLIFTNFRIYISFQYEKIRNTSTHPPIHKGSASKSSSQERCVIVEERPSANDDIKPLPPRSFVSHLGVGVPTHSAEECQQMISTADKLSSIFIQRLVDIFLWAIFFECL